MFKLSKELEYLLPLLLGMPLWVKSFFVIWAILTLIIIFIRSKSWFVRVWLIISIVLAIIIVSFTYTKNKETALKEKSYTLETAKIEINRLIEDSESSSLKIAKQFPEEINKIIGSEFGGDGSKVADLMVLPNTYNGKIDAEYKNLMRDVEDICLKNFYQKDIKLIPDLKAEAQKIDDLSNRLKTYKESFEREIKETKLYQDFIANK